MKTKPKSINLFLIDGESSGRLKAQLSNWNGVVCKMPRSLLAACLEGGDITRYFQPVSKAENAIKYQLDEDLTQSYDKMTFDMKSDLIQNILTGKTVQGMQFSY